MPRSATTNIVTLSPTARSASSAARCTDVRCARKSRRASLRRSRRRARRETRRELHALRGRPRDLGPAFTRSRCIDADSTHRSDRDRRRLRAQLPEDARDEVIDAPAPYRTRRQRAARDRARGFRRAPRDPSQLRAVRTAGTEPRQRAGLSRAPPRPCVVGDLDRCKEGRPTRSPVRPDSVACRLSGRSAPSRFESRRFGSRRSCDARRSRIEI